MNISWTMTFLGTRKTLMYRGWREGRSSTILFWNILGASPCYSSNVHKTTNPDRFFCRNARHIFFLLLVPNLKTTTPGKWRGLFESIARLNIWESSPLGKNEKKVNQVCRLSIIKEANNAYLIKFVSKIFFRLGSQHFISAFGFWNDNPTPREQAMHLGAVDNGRGSNEERLHGPHHTL